MIKINSNPSVSILRQFSISLVIVICFLSFKYRNAVVENKSWQVLVGLFLIAGIVGFFLPRAVKFLFLILCYLSFPIGFVVSYLLLWVSFYLLICPVALIMRFFGRDRLRVRKIPEANTFWLKRTPVTDFEYYLHQ